MKHRVAVVGGGITGLAAAYELQRRARALKGNAPPRIQLIEASDRLGGKIHTERDRGLLIEAGPDSMISQKPWAVDLCDELGLSDKLVAPQPGRKTYILFAGKLRELPRGAMGFIPTHFTSFLRSDLFSIPGKLRMGLELLVPPRRDGGDESLGEFVRRRLGSEPLVRLAEPLLAGVYAADADQLSLQASFPQLRSLEQGHKSLIAGALLHRRRRRSREGRPNPLFLALDSGLGALVDALEDRLDDVQILTGLPVLRLESTGGDGRYSLQLGNGQAIVSDAVIVATPAHVSADLMERVSPEAAELLSGISYASTAVVTLAYRRADVDHPLDATGFLVPRTEDRVLTACTWSSSKWPHRAPPDMALFRCFLGRAGQQDVLHTGGQGLVQLAVRELDEIVGLRGEPVLSRVHRWPRSMPQYEVGHLDRLGRVETALAGHPGLALAGAGYRGIGIPDCVRQGREAAEQVLRYLYSSRRVSSAG